MRHTVRGLVLIVLAFWACGARADTLGLLGSAGGFAVYGGAAVTNTGASELTGNVGSGTAPTGFPPGIVNGGALYVSDPVEMLAQSAAILGFDALGGLVSTENLTGQNLGGLLLGPGVYSFASSAQLTGVLTLNFEGLSNQSIVFQTGSTLTTATDSSVNIINAGLNDSVYWEIGSSATLGVGTALDGYLLAAASITLDTGASITNGDALALQGAVTLDDNSINLPVASSLPGSGTTAAPEPGGLMLVGTGLTGLVGVVRRGSRRLKR